VALLERTLVMVPDHSEASLGRSAGLAAPDQKGAGGFLQRLDALRDGRGCDMQFRRRKIERPAPMDGSQGGKLGAVLH
jgi:hypothetical protein